MFFLSWHRGVEINYCEREITCFVKIWDVDWKEKRVEEKWFFSTLIRDRTDTLFQRGTFCILHLQLSFMFPYRMTKAFQWYDQMNNDSNERGEMKYMRCWLELVKFTIKMNNNVSELQHISRNISTTVTTFVHTLLLKYLMKL